MLIATLNRRNKTVNLTTRELLYLEDLAKLFESIRIAPGHGKFK
jgi:hypothetical protein